MSFTGSCYCGKIKYEADGDASYGVQAIGVVSVGIFTLVASGIIWSILKMAMGIRVEDDGEMLGLDKTELGIEAYPEFSRT